jgi:sphinganine-1-phosphate aldolase
MLWQGGFYGSPSVAGSRPGSVIAGTWAAIARIGRQGYTKIVKDILTAQASIIERLQNEVPEVDIATQDVSSIVSIVTKKGKD